MSAPDTMSDDEWQAALKRLSRDDQFKHVLGNIRLYADEHHLSAITVLSYFNAGLVSATILSPPSTGHKTPPPPLEDQWGIVRKGG